MISIIREQTSDIISADHYTPSVTVILSTVHVNAENAKITHALKLASDEVQHKLNKTYPKEQADAVIKRLQRLITEINTQALKKSLVLFVSPVFEKAMYLNCIAEPKIVIGDSFRIRELVLSLSQQQKYILVRLLPQKSDIFLGNGDELQSYSPVDIPSTELIENDIAERVANFSDPVVRKSQLLLKELFLADHALDSTLKKHPLPVFLAGSKKTIGYFRKITRHRRQLASAIPGNYLYQSVQELAGIVFPVVQNWFEENDSSNTILSLAADTNRLVTGVAGIWNYVSHGQSGHLFVEQDLTFPATSGEKYDIIYPASMNYNEKDYIPDAVDNILEKVLEYGGDVTFSEAGLLHDLGGIALIKYA